MPVSPLSGIVQGLAGIFLFTPILKLDKLGRMSDFDAVFAALKPVLEKQSSRLAVKTDTPIEYALVTKTVSPFPQHKGHPMDFGSIRMGKAYVSFHLMPLYMCDPLLAKIPETLTKRMQGKTCFNFKEVPDPAVLKELKALTEECRKAWKERNWL
jgi:hypothetical protein